MKTIFRIAFCTLLAAGPGAQAQTDDVVRIVNRLRAPGGSCAAAAPPLLPQGALDVTASRLARGASLGAALKSAAYRMTEVQVITLAGEGLRARLEALLASRFCSQISMPELSEAGAYERGNQIWIVLVNDARAEPRTCGDKPFGSARSVIWNEALERSAAAAEMAPAIPCAGCDY